jgi:cytochrome P450
VTRYKDVVDVLHHYSAERTPTPEQLTNIGLASLNPIAQVMLKQMLFLDPPAHTRLRSLAAYAFTPGRVEVLRGHIREITNSLLDKVQAEGHMDVIADLAEPLPCIVTAEMLGVPVEDHQQLKVWSQDFAEMLGNFQHNPDRVPRILKSVREMTAYFQSALREQRFRPRDGLVSALMNAEIQGDRLTEEEVIANCIVTMVGGQETTTNLIGNGVLSLLRSPDQLEKLRSDLALIPSAVEELLRYESPSQHTARLAPEDTILGGKLIRKRHAVIAVMAAGNRDPERFPNPDSLEITRDDNRHLAFGWAAHFCFGAALARLEGQIAFELMLRRLSRWTLEPEPLVWRSNLGLRGLTKLPIRFNDSTVKPDSRSMRNGTEFADGSKFSSVQGSTSLSETKRKLLQRYLSGDVSQTVASPHPITPRPSGEPALLSLSQEQLLLREGSVPNVPPLYNECITLRMEGSLEVPLLNRSLAEIIRRHEIWRTSYDIRNGLLVQVVHPATPEMRLPVVDLRGMRKERLEEEARHLAAEEARRPFDLSRGPLLRAVLVRTGAVEYRLSVIAHLSIVDGISVYRLFPAELAMLYSVFSAGKPSPFPELPIQYADYAHWQRQWLRDNELKSQLTYWRNQLAGELPVLRWPADNPRPAVQTYRGAIRPFALSRSLTAALRELIRREGVTLFTTLLASFAGLMYCYTSQVDLVIGTPSPCGRKRSEFQALLGYFLNPVALRVDLQDDPSLRELLLRAQKVIAEAFSYDDLPIEVLAKELRPKPDSSRNPLFTLAISLQPTAPDEATGWHVTSMDAESGGAPWDLYLAFINRGDELIGRVQYNPDLFESLTISQMLRDLQRVMMTLVADPGQSISSLPLVVQEPRVVGQKTNSCPF